MLVQVGEKRVTSESVNISTDKETGRKLAFYLFALATGRTGYTEEDVSFACTVKGDSFTEVIRITGAQQEHPRLYTFQGIFQGISVEGSFETSGHTGVIRKAS